MGKAKGEVIQNTSVWINVARLRIPVSAAAFLIYFLAMIASINAYNEDNKDKMLETVKRLCQGYVQGFMSPDTNLVYGRRINGPRGIEVLEKSEEIARERFQGQYKPYGYGAGIEDVALQNGYLIFALCDAFEATGEPYFADLARRVLKGLRLVGTISPVPGFVPRGPHPDGKSYYRDSSLDQHTLFICGLWRYYHSRIASSEERKFIRQIVEKFARRMEQNKWVLMVEDNSRVAHAGGDWLPMGSYSAPILLSMLAAVQDVTDDEHWREEYEKYGNEDNGQRWKLLCAETKQLPRYTMFSNQAAFRLATLALIENNSVMKEIAKRRLRNMAEDMLTCNFFTHWRRLDWIGELSDEEVNAYLGPIGFSLNSEATVFNLWRKYDPELRAPRLAANQFGRSYEPMCACTPIISWQVALLSGASEHIRQVDPFVREVFERVDFSRVRSGWTFNYAVVLGLLHLAVQGNS